MVVVEPAPARSGAGVRAENVVECEEVVVPGILDPLHEGDELVGAQVTELRLREHGTETHDGSS